MAPDVTLKSGNSSVRLCGAPWVVDEEVEVELPTPATAAWDASTHELTLWVCPGLALQAFEDVSFVFNVTNPAQEQLSPAIRLLATGPVEFVRVFVAKPAALFLGVVNGTDPLQILMPRFLEREISQATPHPKP